MANHPDVASGQWDFAGERGYCYEVYAIAFEDIGGTTQGAGSPTYCAYWAPPTYRLMTCSHIADATYYLNEQYYAEGTSVTLRPDTPRDYRFTGWSGDMTSSEETQLPNARQGYNRMRQLRLRSATSTASSWWYRKRQ